MPHGEVQKPGDRQKQGLRHWVPAHESRRQPPTSLRIPASWSAHLCVVPSHTAPWLGCVTNSMWQRWYVTSRIRIQKTLWHLSWMLSLLFTQGKTTCHVWGRSGSGRWGPCCEELMSLTNKQWGPRTCPRPRVNFQVDHPVSMTAAQADSWTATSTELWARNNQLSHSWIPDLWKLWDNKCWLCYATKLWVIYCIRIDN